MPVTWTRFQSANTEPPLTVEKIFKLYGSWAGIHDFDFEALVDIETVSVTGVTGGGWTTSEVEVDLPPNFSFRYHKTGWEQAVEFSDVPAGLTYLFGTDSSGHPFVRANGNIVHYLDKLTPTEADVEIVFRQEILDEKSSSVRHSMSMYMNDRWYTTYATEGNISVLENVKLKMAAYDTDVMTYTDLRMPELCETAEFGTLDPGENGSGGLQRTIEGRYLKYFVRADGTLRAWRKKVRDNVFIFGSSVEGFQRYHDLPALITHARMRGAYVEGVYYDETLTALYMHRFVELDNAMLFTKRECVIEAENTVRRSEEAAFSISFNAHWVPILEPEDRVVADGDDWVLNGFSISGSPGRARASYNGRKYVWE